MRIRFGRMFMPRCQSFKLTFVILVVVLNIFCEALLVLCIPCSYYY